MLFPNGGETLKYTYFISLLPSLISFLLGIILINITNGYIDKNTKKTFFGGLGAILYHFIIICIPLLYSSIVDIADGNCELNLFTVGIAAIELVIVIRSFIAIIKYSKQNDVFKRNKE